MIDGWKTDSFALALTPCAMRYALCATDNGK